MNPFLLPSAERLADWKQFRNSLTGMDEYQQLTAVATYWAQAPLLTTVCDLDCCDNWLTIWEMIYGNQWCRNSVAIGMEATLRLAGLSANRMILRLIYVEGFLLVLVIDNQWMLNYDWGYIRPYSDHQIICEWQFIDKSYLTLDG